VWNDWVNNYLLGRRPPALDILFWNNDTTRMPARLHADFVDLAIRNQLVTGELTVLGTPVDLGRVTVDGYVVAGISDHSPPDRAATAAPACWGSEPVRALDERSHRGARQPAHQPEGDVPGRQGHPTGRRRVAARGGHRGGQLVAGPPHLARGPLRSRAPDRFLLDRWRLHTRHVGTRLRVPIRHDPWVLRDVEVAEVDDGILGSARLADLAERPPDHGAFSPGTYAECGVPRSARRRWGR